MLDMSIVVRLEKLRGFFPSKRIPDNSLTDAFAFSLQYMEELALIVDEIQYNLYILSDLTPSAKKNLSIDWTEKYIND